MRLSNGSTIFDLAGNLMEWVDWDKDTIGFQVGPNTCASSWVELSTLSCPALQDSDYNTTSGTLTSTEGIGLFYGGAGSAILRSGRWVDQFYGGIFMMHLNNPPTFIVDYIGFRCVYRE